jgi:hypothetical protein
VEESGDDLPSSSGNDNVIELQAQVQELEGEMARERAAKKEWEAAAEGLSGLHAEVKRLEGELGKAQERRIEAEQQQIACSREKTTLMTDLVELRKKLAAKEEELAAKEGQIEGKKKEIKRLLSLVKAAEEERDGSKEAQANAERALSEAGVAGSRRSHDETRFHFIQAGTGQVGSIPRSYLDLVPESLLTKMYNGEWDYARDEQWRALINCHPEQWAAIMEHLATGTVPTERDQRLLDQARHWNLERLVQALEALTPGVTLTNDPDGKTCTAQCKFYPVMEKLHDKSTLKFTFCGPRNMVVFGNRLERSLSSCRS